MAFVNASTFATAATLATLALVAVPLAAEPRSAAPNPAAHVNDGYGEYVYVPAGAFEMGTPPATA